MAATEPLIAGALITRVDRPFPSLYAFSLSWRGGGGCLALAGGPERPVPVLAVLSDRPRGETADGEVRGLREKLESGRLRALFRSADGHGWALVVERGEHVYLVSLSARGLSVAPVRVDEVGPQDRGFEPIDLEPTPASAFVAEHQRLLVQRFRASALRAVARARARLERRRTAIESDVGAMAEADARAAYATLFVGAARSASARTRELVATDWSSGEPVEARFPLRGDRPAHQEIEAVFHHAKRLRGGLARAEARAREAALASELLASASSRLEIAEDKTSVEREIARLQKALPGDVRLVLERVDRAAGKRAEPSARKSHRSFVSITGAPLLVGKGGADNDELTLRVARPHDHFFHAKDAKGAHVIAVAQSKTAPLDARVLVEGALLAAHFSDRRGEAVVDVQHCARRHLRKRKGAPPGLVELSQEKVIAVRSDEATLARLLASEDRG